MQYFTYKEDTTRHKKEIAFECKGSKFIAMLFPLNVYTRDKNTTLEHHHVLKNEILAKLQSLHKKASHFVWAFRVLNEYQQVIEGSSDDGEPKGSSGVPMLEVLRSKCLINIICVCVRYFGGTKLGVGGLVRAYTQATLQTITSLENLGQIIPYQAQDIAIIHIKSNAYNKILHLATQHKLEVVNREFIQSSITIQLKGNTKNIEDFLIKYKNIYYNGNISNKSFTP